MPELRSSAVGSRIDGSHKQLGHALCNVHSVRGGMGGCGGGVRGGGGMAGEAAYPANEVLLANLHGQTRGHCAQQAVRDLHSPACLLQGSR